MDTTQSETAPPKPRRSRAERRLETAKKVDQLKSEIVLIALDKLNELMQKRPILELEELLSQTLKAAREEASYIFKSIEPQNRHLARRAAAEAKLHIYAAIRKALAEEE